MLYLHWVTLFPGKWLTEPERAGYLKNQVAPFRIPTKDGERLFAWLVTPLGMYAHHVQDFIQEIPAKDDIEQRRAFKLLKEDPEARLLIYFHGNTATVAQGRRTEEYRMYSSGASDKIFVLAFDYRGFGKSTGSPSELGLMNDAEAVVEWALGTAGIAPDRIVLLGHSLGTAVATGITHYYANLATPTEFAGLILCASFTNTGSAFASYAIGDLIPNDGTMPWDQTEELFKSTLRAATEEVGPDVKVANLGEAGNQQVWRQGTRSISKLIAKHGGKLPSRDALHECAKGPILTNIDHNTMMKWAPISLAVLESFGLTNVSVARIAETPYE
ncbi:uncharacterized protein N0V89_006078 [Didymosphaeria variabile]|uniref:AB hydrolase-1 domain-containing protein n=1 Tax=Didymosphaeria variabile TaxID=1932322 RepID=A0A9W8XND8_9PLEO|nr:uncharacterized protein N0V89_006078 [Didymosphaeria variabile]KAJ4354343.1 hypothetical protein N0V89_006078 [Didymosphaeria variabile]